MRVAAAAGEPYVGGLIGTGLKVGVVVSRFNDLVTKLLLDGALGAFQRHGVASADVDVSCFAGGRGAWCTLVMLCLDAWQLCDAWVACPEAAAAAGDPPACSMPPPAKPNLAHRAPPCLSLAPQVAWVPGAFELPVVAKAMAKSGKYDAVVCIGVVVSGDRWWGWGDDDM